MQIYFGFIPTDALNKQIDTNIQIMGSDADGDYNLYRDEVTKQISHELLDNLLTKMLDLIADKARRTKMQKLTNAIHTAIDTLLKHILINLPNEKVVDTYFFMKDKCLFIDNDGNRRVGFQLSSQDAEAVKLGLQHATNSADPHPHLQTVMDILIRANLEHFVVDFSKHLHLGMIKRKAIPIAEAAVNKASQAAIHKLLPSMDNEACLRLTNHFAQFVVIKDE
ncbi:hypothetical protein VH441_02950 [Psychrobacter sp. HD31]|uniref:hypothetical protein n=1 Tax=Psychrobacter sp. HD31 TaxID=3112003 RepID=UPI003DA3FB6A